MVILEMNVQNWFNMSTLTISAVAIICSFRHKLWWSNAENWWSNQTRVGECGRWANGSLSCFYLPAWPSLAAAGSLTRGLTLCDSTPTWTRLMDLWYHFLYILYWFVTFQSLGGHRFLWLTYWINIRLHSNLACINVKLTRCHNNDNAFRIYIVTLNHFVICNLEMDAIIIQIT